MTLLLPRLPSGIASVLFDQGVNTLEPSTSHPAQLYSPVGGTRAGYRELESARSAIMAVAEESGFPEPASESARIAFDRAAAAAVSATLDLTWAEAGSRDGWSFLSLVLLPDLTRWRFHGSTNRERWVASDLTRHTWSRLWWQAEVFGDADELLGSLTESDLNQLLERRSIGGDPRLVQALGRSVVQSPDAGVTRRELIRDASARIRRRLAFLDVRSLDDVQIQSLCDGMVAESAYAIRVLKAR